MITNATRTTKPDILIKGIDEITITMTYDVASTLLQIMNAIGGPSDGPRGHTDGVSNALDACDVRAARHKTCAGARSIYFQDQGTK